MARSSRTPPSCGLYRVKVYGKKDVPPNPQGRGLYAAGIAHKRPDLPMEENGRLHDPALRENVVIRTFVHAHWRVLLAAVLTAKSLIAFHTAYKYLVMAHSIRGYRLLGRLLSDLLTGVERIAGQYFSQLMLALAQPASRGGRANVLSHLQGCVKDQLSGSSRKGPAKMIRSYCRGEPPLMAPLALLKHHLGEHEATYAWNQIYLQLHPVSAGLPRDL